MTASHLARRRIGYNWCDGIDQYCKPIYQGDKEIEYFLNPDEMNKEFNNVDWNISYQKQNVNEALSYFNTKIKNIFDKHAPFTSKKI